MRSTEPMKLDPKIFHIQDLLEELLYLENEPGNWWRKSVEIIPDYVDPGDLANVKRCVVKYGNKFLRYSRGPRQGHFWDVYGEDYVTPELAFVALLQAPPP